MCKVLKIWHSQLKWNEAISCLPVLALRQSVNILPLAYLVSTFCLLLVISLSKMVPKCSAGVLSTIPKYKKDVMCLTERIHGLDALQFSLVAQSCPTLCDPMDHSMPDQLPESTQTRVHRVGDAIQPFHPLSSPSPALNLPQHQGFSNESAVLIGWPKYWSFSFSINEHPGVISFRMDWLDLLAVQGTLKSLLQHHSSKASILQRSAFFMVQLSHPYMTTGKTIALTRLTFVGEVISLLFNMLSRLVITFLPRSKRLNFMAIITICIILEPRKIKPDTVSTVSPSICHEVIGLDTMILVFWMLSFKPTFSLSPLSLSSRGSLVLLHFLP